VTSRRHQPFGFLPLFCGEFRAVPPCLANACSENRCAARLCHQQHPNLQRPARRRFDTLPKHQSEGEARPLFTPAELRRVNAYFQFYIDGYTVLRKLEQAISRPGLSHSEVKEIAKLSQEIIDMIHVFEPIVEAFDRLFTKQAKVALQCREFNTWVNK
jgi:hypothetical protein